MIAWGILFEIHSLHNPLFIILIVWIFYIIIDRLRQMAIFAKTIDHGSFRGAAKELRLSPSVVSHHISQLEESLGVVLLYRSTRKLALTADGERLLAATRNMLAAVEGELQTLSAEANEPSGELRVTAPSVLSKAPFIGDVAALMARYPRISLTLDFSDERKELIRDRFDIAIRMSPKAKRSGSSRVLFTVERILVALPSFLEMFPRPETPADLGGLDWLELAPVRNMPTVLQRDKSKQVLRQKQSRLSCNDAQGLYSLALAGAGLAVVPAFLAANDLASGGIECVLPDWQPSPLEVYADWPSNAAKDGLIKLFVDGLSEGK